MKYDAPLIITGAPRSGTTGIQCALSAMQGVCVWYEFELYSVGLAPYHCIVDRCSRLVEKRDDKGFERGDMLTDHTLLRNPLIGLKPLRSILNEVKLLEGRYDREVLRDHLFDTAEAVHGDDLRLYGDKVPLLYLKQLPEVMNEYPHAKVIVTVRDGRDVVGSLMARGHKRQWAAGIWFESMMLLDRWRTDPHIEDRLLLVRLEEAAEAPQKVLHEIADFTGLRPTDEDEAFWRRLYTPVNVGRGKRECPDLGEIEGAEFADMLRRWDY